MASAGISIMPVLGDIKDAQEAVTGVDFVTGERLTKVERGISFACMLIPIVNGKMIIKGGKKLVRIGSEVPGSVIKVSNVVTKNTAKYKVYLRKVWIDEKESINKFIGQAKDTVRKFKNGEPYADEYVTPEGYRIEVSDLDDAPKNGAVYHKSISESGIKTVNGYDAKVNVGQQNKHIPGTNEYKNALKNGQNKSILYGDTNDIQNLLNQKAGTGDFLGTNKERVNFGKVIGQYIDPNTGIGVETTMGIIHYGKKGAHIVPARSN